MTTGDRSASAREWTIVIGCFVLLVAVALTWLAVDRTPPEWDHANHLERAVGCAGDLARRDLRAILARSSFYPPVVPCAAAVAYRLAPSDAAAAQIVVLAFLGVGMGAVYALGRRLAGGTEGVVAAIVFGSAPFVVFLTLRFQLDLPLAAMVALALAVLLRTERFTRRGWSLLTGVVFGVGMLTKPTFAVYVLPSFLVLAVRLRRGHAWANAVLAVLIGAALSAPWYGPRLLGLASQIGTRAFRQAAEGGHPDPFTAEALLFYPTMLMPQFGILAVLLLVLGVYAAVVRREEVALASLLAPFLLFEFLQNKNLRYTLPLLPIAAVVAGMGFGVLRGRGRSVASMLLAVACVLQVTATAFAVPGGWKLPSLRVPFVYESPPRTGDWRHREILGLITRESGGRPAAVSVVPNDNFFSVSNFRYYAQRDGLPLRFTRAWDGEPVGIEYMILKTGDVGPAWTAEKPRRIAERLRVDPHLARVFPVIGEWSLPDGSTASVRARRLTEAVAVDTAVFSREVEAAIRRELAAVAVEVEGLQIRLVHDEVIRTGRIRRVEILAASARVGDLKRRGAPLLRLSDVRIAFDDVLVNPFSVHAETRLGPLDARRVTIVQATVSEADFRAFLREQKAFRRSTVRLEPGAVAIVVGQSGPDVAARIRLLPGADRPFTVVAEDVRVGGVPVPSLLVDWVIRNYDPSARLASRVPVPVSLGAIDIAPGAVRISSRP